MRLPSEGRFARKLPPLLGKLACARQMIGNREARKADALTAVVPGFARGRRLTSSIRWCSALLEHGVYENLPLRWGRWRALVNSLTLDSSSVTARRSDKGLS